MVLECRYSKLVWCKQRAYLLSSGLLWEHLLGCLLEIGATFIIKLLFCVRRSSLRLSVLKRLRVLVLVRSRRLLHAHHGAGVSALPRVVAHRAHPRVHSWIESLWSRGRDSAFTGHHWRLSHCSCLNLWLFPYYVKHAVLECFFIFTKTVLLPGVVEDLDVEVVTFHALIEEADAVFVVRVLLELQTPAILHIFFEFDWVAAAELIQRSL